MEEHFWMDFTITNQSCHLYSGGINTQQGYCGKMRCRCRNWLVYFHQQKQYSGRNIDEKLRNTYIRFKRTVHAVLRQAVSVQRKSFFCCCFSSITNCVSTAAIGFNPVDESHAHTSAPLFYTCVRARTTFFNYFVNIHNLSRQRSSRWLLRGELPVEMRILEIWRQSLLDTHNKAL